MKEWTREEIALRPARRDDAPAIAGLFLIASDGLARYIWSRIDMPGKTLEEIGAVRYAREGVAFSYQNCLVAEHVVLPYAESGDYGRLYMAGVAVVPA